jgi:hypothetical protein
MHHYVVGDGEVIAQPHDVIEGEILSSGVRSKNATGTDLKEAD